MGVYALLRLWRSHKQGHLWVVWATGQVGALGLYTVLIVTQMSKHWPGDGTVDGWLKTEFLQPGQNVMSFVLRGSLNQFRYGIGVRSLGVFAGAAFLFGLCRLWKNGKPLHAMLLVLPICLGCLGAVLHLFPYGASRHTAVVGIAVAAGIGSAAAALTRNRILPIFLASFLMLPVWNWFGEDHYFPVSHERRSLSQMRQATQFLISAVPVGSVVVTDGGTYYMLAYYLNSNEVTLAGHVDGAHEVAGLHFAVARTFRFVGDAALRQFLSQTRHSYNLEGPVWVATGGYDIEVTNPASNAKPFEKTIAIFENSDPPVAMSGLTPGI
jgi:hypothetical protein